MKQAVSEPIAWGKIKNYILPAMVFGLVGCQVIASPTPISKPVRGAPNAVGTSTSRPTATALATLPSTPTLPEPILITHGDRTHPYIALTFDACQSPDQPAGYDATIIDILTSTNTPATLFLGGLWMQRHPNQTRTLAANPLFELGNHSWSHADFATLTPQEMNREIERTQALMAALTGQKPTLFRFPAGSHTQEALDVVEQYGLQAIQWDVVSGDPDPGISARDIVTEVTTQTQNGSIVIMHMNGWGWHTAEALPDVIRQLREQGYTFVIVSQLLRSSETGIFEDR